MNRGEKHREEDEEEAEGMRGTIRMEQSPGVLQRAVGRRKGIVHSSRVIKQGNKRRLGTLLLILTRGAGA